MGLACEWQEVCLQKGRVGQWAGAQQWKEIAQGIGRMREDRWSDKRTDVKQTIKGRSDGETGQAGKTEEDRQRNRTRENRTRKMRNVEQLGGDSKGMSTLQ